MVESDVPVDLGAFDSNTESVALEMTAKGQMKWTIKVRSQTLTTSDIDRLKDIHKRLLSDYPNNCSKPII